MAHFSYGVVLKKGTATPNQQRFLQDLFQQNYLQLPRKAFDWDSPYMHFTTSQPECVRVATTDNFIYVSCWGLQSQIDINSQRFPDSLKENASLTLIYNCNIPEFLLRQEPNITYSESSSLEPLDLIKLSKRFEGVRLIENEYNETVYCVNDVNNNCYQEFELPEAVLYDLLDERFEYKQLFDENKAQKSYFILYEGDLDGIDLDFYTGKSSRFAAEAQIKELRGKSRFHLALDIWRNSMNNTQRKSVWDYFKVVFNLFLSLTMLAFLVIFGKSDEPEFKRRFHIRFSIVVYGVFMFMGFIWINFLERPESWKDLGKFFGVLAFGSFLSSRFLKLMLLKK